MVASELLLASVSLLDRLPAWMLPPELVRTSLPSVAVRLPAESRPLPAPRLMLPATIGVAAALSEPEALILTELSSSVEPLPPESPPTVMSPLPPLVVTVIELLTAVRLPVPMLPPLSLRLMAPPALMAPAPMLPPVASKLTPLLELTLLTLRFPALALSDTSPPALRSYRLRLVPRTVALPPANRLLEPPLALTWPPALSDRAPLALMLLV